ncbi:MAG: hypothetical protein V1887_02780 [Candidatus Aenigmatarchaeota archaeon]
MASEEEIENALASIPYMRLAEAAKSEMPIRTFKENYEWSNWACLSQTRTRYYEIEGVAKQALAAFYRMKLRAPEDIVDRVMANMVDLNYLREHAKSGICCAPASRSFHEYSDSVEFTPRRLTEEDRWPSNVMEFLV